jgi:hypothetical protein
VASLARLGFLAVAFMCLVVGFRSLKKRPSGGGYFPSVRPIGGTDAENPPAVRGIPCGKFAEKSLLSHIGFGHWV